MRNQRMRNLVMMMISAGCLAAGWGCAATPGVMVRVSNPTQDDWAEAPVVLPWSGGLASLPPGELVAVSEGIAGYVQRDDLNADGGTDEIVFLACLKAGETRRYILRPGRPTRPVVRRAHAGMYLRGLVGPGWESDVIAYRIYWNNETALDIFGKTRPMLSLAAYASGEFNYHVESPYGLDVLKVGRSLGAGGFGVWIDGQIWKVSDALRTHFVRADGPLRAVLDVEFIDWYVGPGEKKPGETGPGIQRRLDLYGRLSIIAGQKWGQADLLIRPVDKGPVPEIVAGVVRHEQTELILNRDLGIVGRWGRQALGDHEVPHAGDLGLGVVVDPGQVVAWGEDALNSYARLQCVDGRVSYRYHGSWFKEPDGARSARDYQAMLEAVARLRPVVHIER